MNSFKLHYFKKICIISIIVLATIVRFLSIRHIYYVDIIEFHLQWITHVDEYGLLNLYSQGSTVDYPPVFVVLLSLIRKPILYFYNADYIYLFCLFIKLVPILTNLVFISYLYKKGYHKLALLWYINPAIIINCEMMGQTDTILSIIVIAMLYLLINHKTLQATLVFALGCLVKLQMFYYLPILIVYLVKLKNVKKAIGYFTCGIGFGYLVWLPFCINNKDLLLPFKIYLGGFGKYKLFSMNAVNLYVMLNGKSYENKKIIGIPLEIINYIIIFACIAFIVICLIKLKDNKNIFNLVGFYIFFLFYFTFAQHERYTTPCIALFIVGECVIKCKKSKALLFFSTLLCTFNQLWSLAYDVFREDIPFKYSAQLCGIFLFACIPLSVIVLVNVFKQLHTHINTNQ